MKKTNPKAKPQPTSKLYRTHLTKANNQIEVYITTKESFWNKFQKQNSQFITKATKTYSEINTNE